MGWTGCSPREAVVADCRPEQKAAGTAPKVIGVDIGKETFHLVGFTADGQIAFRRKIKRSALAAGRAAHAP